MQVMLGNKFEFLHNSKVLKLELFYGSTMANTSAKHKHFTGTLDGTHNAIKYVTSGDVLAENNQQLLSCSQSNWFWISWAHNVITVGKSLGKMKTAQEHIGIFNNSVA